MIINNEDLREYHLLRLVAAPHIQVVVKGWPADREQLEYMYATHHCPTNITDAIPAVWVETAEGLDKDHHGLFEFVRVVPEDELDN